MKEVEPLAQLEFVLPLFLLHYLLNHQLLIFEERTPQRRIPRFNRQTSFLKSRDLIFHEHPFWGRPPNLQLLLETLNFGIKIALDLLLSLLETARGWRNLV